MAAQAGLSDLVVNPKDRVSGVAAQLLPGICLSFLSSQLTNTQLSLCDLKY